MIDELKPCPFCGGTANIAKGRIEFWVYCPHCGAQTELYETAKEATDAWNYRQREKHLTDKILSLEIDLAHFPGDEYRRINEQLQKEYERYFNAFVEVQKILKESRLADYPYYFNVDNKDIEYIFDIVDKTLRGEDVKTM